MGRVWRDDETPFTTKKEQPVTTNVPSSLELTQIAIAQIDEWRLDAIHAAAHDDIVPLTSLTNCLVTLLRMGGNGYAESDTLVVVNTNVGMQVGMFRDRKNVCSLNS